MIDVIRTSIYLIDMESESHRPYDNRLLKEFVCIRSDENTKRINRIVSILVDKYDNHKLIESRGYCNIYSRDFFTNAVWSGFKIQPVSSHFSLPANKEEALKIKKRRLSALKGALTRNINKAKRLRAEYYLTLFPNLYKEDKKFIRLIANIKINKTKYLAFKKELGEF